MGEATYHQGKTGRGGMLGGVEAMLRTREEMKRRFREINFFLDPLCYYMAGGEIEERMRSVMSQTCLLANFKRLHNSDVSSAWCDGRCQQGCSRYCKS